MKTDTYTSQNSQDLKSFATKFIEGKMKERRVRALVVSLVGNLGTGKTTFVQGVAQSLGIARSMPSPTFTIMREVALPKEISGITMIYHFDWFRLESKEQVSSLGWNDIIQNPKHLVLVEWGDKFPSLFPEGTHQITLSHKGTDRTLTTSVL